MNKYMSYAIKHKKWTKFDEKKGWTPSKKNIKGSQPDLNWAAKKLKKKW